MSNHLHIVVHMSPAAANVWLPEEVAARWVRLYPARNAELCAQKMAAILENTALIAEYRARLTNLSWLMKSLSEPIARRANEEDKVSGRFWEGRFKCQALLSEKSILTAMTYVDLNLVRAKIAGGISTSHYTSVKMRNQQLRKNPERANQPLMPLVGVRSFNLPSISVADYIELVDFTGRELHPGKRGRIEASEPKALSKLGLDKKHWTTRVRGIGSGYWRVVGEVEEARAFTDRDGNQRASLEVKAQSVRFLGQRGDGTTGGNMSTGSPTAAPAGAPGVQDEDIPF